MEESTHFWDYVQNADAIIGILGLVLGSTIYSFLHARITLTRYQFLGSKKKLIKRLENLAGRSSLYFSTPKKVGTYIPMEVETYIDLMTAVSIPEKAKELERIFIRWIKMSQSKEVAKIAVPKRGNVILASMIAQRLNLPLLVIREEDSISVRRDSAIEGELRNGDLVLFIDDVISDPLLILKSIEKIESRKGIVYDIITLVDREEWNPQTEIMTSNSKVKYHSLLSLKDDDIKRLISESQ